MRAAPPFKPSSPRYSPSQAEACGSTATLAPGLRAAARQSTSWCSSTPASTSRAPGKRLAASPAQSCPTRTVSRWCVRVRSVSRYWTSCTPAPTAISAIDCASPVSRVSRMQRAACASLSTVRGMPAAVPAMFPVRRADPAFARAAMRHAAPGTRSPRCHAAVSGYRRRRTVSALPCTPVWTGRPGPSAASPSGCGGRAGRQAPGAGKSRPRRDLPRRPKPWQPTARM